MLWNRISHPSPIVTRLRLRRRRPHPSPSSWEHYRHPPFSYQSYLFSFSIILPCRLVAARRATLPSSSSFFHGASGTGATSNGNDRARAAFYHRTGKHNGVSHRKLHGSHQIDRRHDWRVNLRQRPQNVSNVSDHQLLHPKPIRQHNPTRQSFSSQSDNGGTLTTTTPTPTTTPPAADQPHQLPSCHVRSALSSGPVPYEVGWAHQHVLLHHRLHCLRGPSPKRGSSHNDDDRDHLLLFEHQPVYTLGRGASEEHLSFLSRQPAGGAYTSQRLPLVSTWTLLNGARMSSLTRIPTPPPMRPACAVSSPSSPPPPRPNPCFRHAHLPHQTRRRSDLPRPRPIGRLSPPPPKAVFALTDGFALIPPPNRGGYHANPKGI